VNSNLREGRLIGLARNIENGGSVTILATILVDTGSRMDQFIFEEFKGTGNSEIVLDRSLAEAYIFPALNLPASGTRKEERLYSPDNTLRLAKLRRKLADRPPKGGARNFCSTWRPNIPPMRNCCKAFTQETERVSNQGPGGVGVCVHKKRRPATTLPAELYRGVE
jgi:hypothetical protein